MSREELIEGLQYIADSPPHKHGGFHPYAVEIAKAALEILNQPWLDKPDSEGWWWFINEYSQGKPMCMWVEIPNAECLKGKWQKAIVPVG